jgi:serine protease
VINLSLSGVGSCSPEEQAAIDAAVANGAVVVVAAGNQASDVAGFSPANCRNVITVGATDRIGGRASYTNLGEEVDISAPGGDGGDGILTLYNAGTNSPAADTLAYIRGTSFPTAQVSAVVALMRAVNGALEPSVVEQLLRGTARPFTDTTCSPALCGQGILDAAAATAGAADPASVPVTTADADGDDGGGGGCALASRGQTRFDHSLLLLLLGCVARRWLRRASRVA